MAQFVQTMLDFYHDIIDNQSDPRVKNWPLMNSPFPTLAICLSYIYFVKVLGPRIMLSRKPMDLKGVLIVYNFLQVCCNGWLFYQALALGWLFDYSFRCQPVDYSNSPKALMVAVYCWYYFINKFTDFFDTIFFVLRKKNNHISTLHVTHHSLMPVCCWIGIKFTPGGHGTFFGLINTLVHVVMYTYYMVAAFGPRFQKYLWWKKYLTVLQMVQFLLVFIHSIQVFFIECDYKKWLLAPLCVFALTFFLLFANFYKQEYSKQQPNKMNEATLHEQHDVPPGSYTTVPRHRAFVKGVTSH